MLCKIEMLKYMDTFFSSKKMLHANLCKSHSFIVMASCVSSVVTCQSSMLNWSLMNFLGSLVFSISICKTFALDHFSKSTKKTWISPTFMNFTSKIPYMHLPIGLGSSSLNVGRLLSSLHKTSLTPLSLDSSTNPPFFYMFTSFLRAFLLLLRQPP